MTFPERTKDKKKKLPSGEKELDHLKRKDVLASMHARNQKSIPYNAADPSKVMQEI